MEALSVPVINIGPWGKDLHKFTERVFKADLFERTPALLEAAIDYLLENV
jgi:arginine utilization protein RocB